MTHHDIVIVGAGIAGVKAAATALGHDTAPTVLLLNDEGWAPYDRPPLSKDLLLGKAEPGQFDLLAAATLDEPRLTLLNGIEAVSLDIGAKTIRLSDGRTVGYRHLILATGAGPRPLDPALLDDGADQTLVYLRTMDDAFRLKAALDKAASRRLVVVGAGYIGLEVAAAARAKGCAVTVLEVGSRILARNAPPLVADFVRERHEREGVTFRFNARISAVKRDGDVVVFTLADGSTVEGDVAVVGIGSLPQDALARDAGIACDGGILIDDRCRTSDSAVFAVGDVARLNTGNGATARFEHWNAARIMGEIAGANACGADDGFAAVPWVWSDQYDMNLQFIGTTGAGSRQILRGDPAGGKWGVLELNDQGVVTGATLINLGKDRRLLEQIIQHRWVVDENGLKDAKIALKTLLPKA